MKKQTRRRWIAALLISAIMSGILASQFTVSAHVPSNEEREPPIMRSATPEIQEKDSNHIPQVNLYINNGSVEFTGYLINDTTYVPLRAFFEEVDQGEIHWNNGIATINSDQVLLSSQQGSNYITVNDRIIYHDQPILNIESRIHVPIRSLAKAYSLEVEWYGQTKSVYLTGDPKGLKKGKDFYAEDDLYWLSRIIYAESGGESLLGKIAVGNVIINRKN